MDPGVIRCTSQLLLVWSASYSLRLQCSGAVTKLSVQSVTWQLCKEVMFFHTLINKTLYEYMVSYHQTASAGMMVIIHIHLMFYLLECS